MTTKLPADDIRDKLILDYGEDQYSDTLKILNSVSELSDRTIRCIIFLANGDIEKLNHYTECADRDYRDVIYWAEYFEGADKTKPRRVRNFNKPFGKEEF